MKLRSRTTWIFIFFISVFIIGFIIGRKTCPKLTPSGTITLTPEKPPSQGGEGILIAVEPYQPHPDQEPSQSISHPLQSSYAEPVLGYKPSWFKFSDSQLNVNVHATQADSINYTFNKQWYPFKPTSPYITKISVYGVSPESVQVEVSAPQEIRKNFSAIVTLTAPNPTWNLIFSYKRIAFHFQSPSNVNAKKLSYGLGYHWKF